MDTPARFTTEEAALLLELLGKINVSPLASDAVRFCDTIQRIAEKIKQLTDTSS